MYERSFAYDLAEHIFETVWLENGVLAADDMPSGSGVLRATRGHITNSRQVIAFGDRGDTSQPAWEILSQMKSGNYLLQGTEPYGFTGSDEKLKRIIITATSPEGHMDRLLDSMLLRDLSSVAVRAAFPEKFDDISDTE